MGDVSITISIAAVIAVVVGELIGILWYTDASPWGRRMAQRYTLSATICNVGLVLILQIIMKDYWHIYKWEDCAVLALVFAVVYFTLEGPHIRWASREMSRFMFHVGHKFALVFAMTFALWHFKDAKHYHLQF